MSILRRCAYLPGGRRRRCGVSIPLEHLADIRPGHRPALEPVVPEELRGARRRHGVGKMSILPEPIRSQLILLRGAGVRRRRPTTTWSLAQALRRSIGANPPPAAGIAYAVPDIPGRRFGALPEVMVRMREQPSGPRAVNGETSVMLRTATTIIRPPSGEPPADKSPAVEFVPRRPAQADPGRQAGRRLPPDGGDRFVMPPRTRGGAASLRSFPRPDGARSARPRGRQGRSLEQ